MHSLKDEFKFKEANTKPEVPAVAGTHLLPNGLKLSRVEQAKYCSGVGKFLYFMKCSCLK